MVLCVALIGFAILMTTRTITVQTSIVPANTQYKDYTGLNGMFEYKLPAEWIASEEKSGGSEIMYRNNFSSKDGKLHGFVEIWNLNRPTINFVNEFRKKLANIVSVKNCRMEPLKINGMEGYVLQYSIKCEKSKYTKAFEVLVLDKGNVFRRFAFYMDESIWRDEFRTLFLNIAAYAKQK